MKPSTFFMDDAAGASGGGGGAASTQSSAQGGAQGATLLGSSAGGQPPTQTAASGQPPASGVVEPFFKDWLKADGTINHAAYDRLPDHLKPFAETFKKYGKVEDLLGGFGHSASLNGKKGLMPLPENADEKTKGEFTNRLRELLHVPEKPEGYGIKRPDAVPENAWNQKYVDGVVSIAHKHAISPEAMKELVAFDAQFAGGLRAEAEAGLTKQFEEANAKLDQAFGADRPRKLALAQRMARTLGIDPSRQEDIGNPHALTNNPDFIVAMARMAEMVSEDKLVAGQSDPQGGMSDQAKALDIINNPQNPLHKAYHDPADPRNAIAIAQVEAHNRAWVAAQKGKRG